MMEYIICVPLLQKSGYDEAEAIYRCERVINCIWNNGKLRVCLLTMISSPSECDDL